MAVVAVNRVGNSSTTSKTLISTVKGLSLQLADGEIVNIVGHDNNTSILFQLPDYNNVILHINTSMETYTISFGAISKLNVL